MIELAAICDDADVLARLGGPSGAAVRAAAARRLSKLDRATLAAQARAVAPAGMRGVHPTWIEHALGTLPKRARVDLANGGADEVGVWLARWAAAGIVALPPADLAWPKAIADVPRVIDLSAYLASVGRDQLALAVNNAPRVANLGTRRTAIARCEGGDVVVIGARTIAPFTDAIIRKQIALRMPRTRGLALLFELAQWSDADDGLPTWDALATPP